MKMKILSIMAITFGLLTAGPSLSLAKSGVAVRVGTSNICVAQNYRGRIFRASSFNSRAACRKAIRKCRRNSFRRNSCYVARRY